MPSEVPDPGVRRYGRIGKYDVVAYIATGGVAAVYKAVDTDLGREVALKVLKPEWLHKPAILERFRREARHVAKLRHENIVAIYEFGEANGVYYLALEFVDGIDLYEYITRRGRLGPERARRITIQIAKALAHLHRHGIVHRDIKPSNVLITRKNGRRLAKLTDLGLARVDQEEEFRVTRAGFTVGTIDYMSPEQARDSGKVDIRSDIYSLGCTLYHMLTGQPPFAEGGLAERIYKHLQVEPPDVRQLNPEVPAGLAAVLRRMLAKDPKARYQTPPELLKGLARPRVEEAPPPLEATVLEEEAALSPEPPRPSEPESAAPAPTAPRPTREQLADADLGPPQSSELVPVTPEQRQAAAGQFERAKQVLASDYDYGIHLLLSCCKLDPANLNYRRLLRRTERAKYKDKPKGKRLAFLKTSPLKSKIKTAKSGQEYLKVLELGEEVLTHTPWDTGVQLEMAEAAEALSLPDLAIWLLEQALQPEAPDVALTRALARLYERRGRLTEAIRLWELVRRADPTDVEASRKPRDLAARETLGQYREEMKRRVSADSR